MPYSQKYTPPYTAFFAILPAGLFSLISTFSGFMPIFDYSKEQLQASDIP